MSSQHSTKSTTISRCSAAEVRKAAGSQSLSRLKAAVASGWTAHEFDTLPAFTTEGKSPLQMAAWKGSLENVQYLVETVGCNINAYSQAPFSYGKTPLFFATTQSRVDVVEYFLTTCRSDIQVAIVNNKGQSIRSLAASHDMPETVMQHIQELEQGQEWWNFRQSHSDCLEYGDLDPRFLDRPLRVCDVVTTVAINPTTKSTRKGGFARRNPQAAEEKLRQREAQTSKKSSRTKQKKHPGLSARDQEEWNDALHRLGSFGSDCETALLTIVRLGDKQRCEWMPQVAEQLTSFWHGGDPQRTLDDVLERTTKLTREKNDDERLVALLEKLSQKIRHNGESGGSGERRKEFTDQAKSKGTSLHSSRKAKARDGQTLELLHSNMGQEAFQCLTGLSLRQDLEHIDSTILRLPKPPVIVESTTHILAIRDLLQPVKLVAIDTEWYQNDDSYSVVASTFQLAFMSSEDGGVMHCYVIDLRLAAADDGKEEQARNFIAKLLEDSDKVVLGFSIGHDFPVLERFVGRKLQPTTVLDLQQLLKEDGESSQLPGLKACTARFSDVPLAKDQQRSDWGQRPLSKEQVDYAGLDAAVLLYMLVEHFRTRPELQKGNIS